MSSEMTINLYQSKTETKSRDWKEKTEQKNRKTQNKKTERHKIKKPRESERHKKHESQKVKAYVLVLSIFKIKMSKTYFLFDKLVSNCNMRQAYFKL